MQWRGTAIATIVLMGACSSAPAEEAADPPTDRPAPPPAVPAPVDPPPPSPALTTVRVHYAGRPGAISLRGARSPLSWDASLPLTAAPGASALYVWSSPDVAAELELKPMLGETWSRGPNYRVKPGETIDVYPRFFEAKGAVAERYPAFVSQKLPSTRGLWVYLPPTYLENTEARMGVLYMHDAQNLFSPSTAFGGNEWKVDETLDAGAEDGSIREVIVVGVENTPARIDELTPTNVPAYGGGKADAYVAMIVDEIKPKIDAELRTLPAREQTAIMGSSLGGLVSAYAGVRRADVFGLVGAMSPSTWWDGTMILGEISSLATKPARPIRVYVDSGDSGPSNDDVANTTLLAQRYRAVGYADDQDLRHVVQAGAQHSETYWASRLPAALAFLLGPRQ
ncbi:MAG: alpha/beta hydrolase [Labilithrix sp.]|nr:alpha/beta hydrolase [Labilithrix sp.]